MMDRIVFRSACWVLGAACLLAAAGASAATPEDMRSCARRLAQTAAREGSRRVAVLPFVPLDDSPSAMGAVLASEFASLMPSYAELETIPPSDQSLGRHRLGESSALTPGEARDIGAVLRADTLMTGAFVSLKDRVDLDIRLLSVESGAIIASARAKVKRSRFLDSHGNFEASEEITAADVILETLRRPEGEPEDGPALVLSSEERASMRDALNGDPCSGAQRKVHRIEAEVLGLKARYWAGQVYRSKVTLDYVKRAAEGTLRDSLLRERYFQLLELALAADAPALTPAETERFIRLDRVAFELQRRCAPSYPGEGRLSLAR